MAAVAELARRWFEELWNQRREAIIDELLVPEGICHSDLGDMDGREVFRRDHFHPFINAFPDLRMNVESILSEGEQAVVRWTALGTHLGPHLGFPPSGKTAAMRGITWMRFDNGKIVEGWQSTNLPIVLAALKGGS